MQSKKPNIRLSSWLKTMKKFNIITSQKDLAKSILTNEGKPVKQEYISAMVSRNAKVNITDHFLDQIIERYSFLRKDYILEGKGNMIEASELMRWVLEEIGSNQKELAKILGIPASSLNKLANIHTDGEWTPIFRFLNEKTGYKVDFDHILYANKNIGSKKIFVAKNPATKRFLAVLDELKRTSLVKDDKDFAEKIGVSKNMIYNMRNEATHQGLTLDILAKTIRIFQRLNPNYILNNEGELYVTNGAAFGILSDIRSQQLQQEQKLDDLLRLIKQTTIL